MYSLQELAASHKMSGGITVDVILWYCLPGFFIEMVVSANENVNTKSQ